jgi:hypothetical protein
MTAISLNFTDLKEIFSLFHVKILLKSKKTIDQEGLLQKFFYAADLGLAHTIGMQFTFQELLILF